MKNKVVAMFCNPQNVCSFDEPKLNADYVGLHGQLLSRFQSMFIQGNTRNASVLLAGTLIDEVKLMQAMLFGIFKEIYISNGVKDQEHISFRDWIKTWTVCIDAVSIDRANVEGIKKGIASNQIGTGVDGLFLGFYYELIEKLPIEEYNGWVNCLQADLLDDRNHSIFGREKYDVVLCVSSLYTKTAIFADKVAKFIKPKGLFLRHTPIKGDPTRSDERDSYMGLKHLKNDDIDSWVYIKTE